VVFSILPGTPQKIYEVLPHEMERGDIIGKVIGKMLSTDYIVQVVTNEKEFFPAEPEVIIEPYNIYIIESGGVYYSCSDDDLETCEPHTIYHIPARTDLKGYNLI
jgi:hypothetical protein